MAQLLVAFISGMLFAAGLVIANVTDPSIVLSFLDITGAWNPQLALVVGGAIGTAALGRLLVRTRAKPVFAQCYAAPMSKRIDSRLVVGSVLFGLGWGLGGYCPAPALAGMTLLDPRTLVFVAAMLVGMMAFHRLHERTGRS